MVEGKMWQQWKDRTLKAVFHDGDTWTCWLLLGLKQTMGEKGSAGIKRQAPQLN